VKLSLGRVENGCLTCPFHGWQFDGDGKCVSVPWNPDARLQTLGGLPVPVQERGGRLWIFTEAGRTETDVELHVPAVTISTELVRWQTHWSRAMENMLDWPHLPFVHTGTIGLGMSGQRMDIEWQETPSGGSTRISIDGKAQAGSLDYLYPNGMMLSVMSEPKRTMTMFVSVIPVDDTTTDMLLCTARSFLRPRVFNPLFRMANRKIAGEDRAVVESSWPVAVPAASAEHSVRTDQPTLAFEPRRETRFGVCRRGESLEGRAGKLPRRSSRKRYMALLESSSDQPRASLRVLPASSA
jgi:phenylpropionate dioxygenase-like ring-hydroxylating dioxygenase large terminal subunit